VWNIVVDMVLGAGQAVTWTNQGVVNPALNLSNFYMNSFDRGQLEFRATRNAGLPAANSLAC
jgi:hypothetical protein